MMEVILRDDIKSLGKAGDLVRVKPGYARNYLLPQGLAYEATEGNKKRIVAETKDAALAAAAGLAAVELTFTRKAGEEGKLFGSITSQDIADSLAAQGKTVDKRRIELPHPIKAVGEHTVIVRLHPEVHADVRVTVAAE